MQFVADAALTALQVTVGCVKGMVAQGESRTHPLPPTHLDCSLGSVCRVEVDVAYATCSALLVQRGHSTHKALQHKKM